jgi:cytoskeleton protein RodZ
MSDFGQRLRRTREKRGISLRAIESRTKIALSTLEALERNDASKLPGGIFARSIVRAYAAEVGLDPDKTVNEFVTRFKLEPLPSLDVVEPDAAASATTRPAVLVTVLLAGLVLFALLLFLTLRRPEAESKTPASPEPAGGVAAAQS